MRPILPSSHHNGVHSTPYQIAAGVGDAIMTMWPSFAWPCFRWPLPEAFSSTATGSRACDR